MRRALKEHLILRNFEQYKHIPLTPDMIINAINHCYDTLDTIDENLINTDVERLSRLIERANLSSIIGNLLCAGLAKNSNNIFIRNLPHTYPDLINKISPEHSIEIKTAVGRNLPKGHHPKEGYYLVFRYSLTNIEGVNIENKSNNEEIITIYEVKFGYLTENDFLLSNTQKDSGKTAIVNTASLHNMTLLYLNTSCLPYKHSDIKPYVGFN